MFVLVQPSSLPVSRLEEISAASASEVEVEARLGIVARPRGDKASKLRTQSEGLTQTDS